MKIISKISLRRGLERMIEPNFAYPKITRQQFQLSANYKLTPSQELHKYSIKPKYFDLRWILLSLFGGLSAIIWNVYENEMYNNQFDTIYRYRFHEEEVGSAKIYVRQIFLQLLFWLEENYWVSALFSKKNMGGQNLDYFAQCLIRYGQYKNYIKKKDTKFDFLDIGVLQKFPYPKKNGQPGME